MKVMMSRFVLENVSQQKDKYENNLLYLLALRKYHLIKKNRLYLTKLCI